MTRAMTLRMRRDGTHTKIETTTKVEASLKYLLKTLPRKYDGVPDAVANVRRHLSHLLGERIAHGVSNAWISVSDKQSTCITAFNAALASNVHQTLSNLQPMIEPALLSWAIAANCEDSKVKVYVDHVNPEDQVSRESHEYEISWWGTA